MNVQVIPHAVGIGSFNRVPSGPREQRAAGWIPTRGALPTRLNECERMCHPQPRAAIHPQSGHQAVQISAGCPNREQWTQPSVPARAAGLLSRC